MNPLELNKDTEIVSNEPTETVISEVNEIVETENPTASATEPIEIATETNEATTSEENTDLNAETKTSKMPDYNLFSKAELVDALKLLLDKEIASIKDEVEIIKQNFYKRAKSDTEEQKRKFMEEGGDEQSFVATKDDLEDALKLLLNEYRAKKVLIQLNSKPKRRII